MLLLDVGVVDIIVDFTFMITSMYTDDVVYVFSIIDVTVRCIASDDVDDNLNTELGTQH